MKIFLDNREILFTAQPDNTAAEHDLLVTKITPAGLKAAWERFTRYDKFERLILPMTAIDGFFKRFPHINAAGGLVHNELDAFLFIHRNNKWDLPKGKLDKLETPQLAAIREVKEETGLTRVELKNELTCTYHMYKIKDTWHLKRTWWYAMFASASQPLTPQASEGIYQVKWIPRENLPAITPHIYPSLKELLTPNS
jgi:8-oxo-(d)GTP phosphatase